MIHQPEYMKELLRKHMDGTATPIEKARLIVAWDLYDDEEISDMIAELTGGYKESELDAPESAAPEPEPTAAAGLSRKQLLVTAIIIVVLLALILGTIAVLSGYRKTKASRPIAFSCTGSRSSGELPLSRFSCSITMSDKRSIQLNSSSPSGIVASDGNIDIVHTAPGVIEYKVARKRARGDTAVRFHLLETSAGQQFRVVLSDGSRVRLNAMSAINMPVPFGKTRALLLRGEAIFDLAPDSSKAFYVQTHNAGISAAAGNFNVKAYPQTSTVATALAGTPLVKSADNEKQVRPGEQAVVYDPGTRVMGELTVQQTATAAVVSWQNNMREYRDVSLLELVSDLGRWHNLRYQQLNCVPPRQRISIYICQDASLEDVLRLFTKQNLKFVRQGKSIRFCPPDDVTKRKVN